MDLMQTARRLSRALIQAITDEDMREAVCFVHQARKRGGVLVHCAQVGPSAPFARFGRGLARALATMSVAARLTFAFAPGNPPVLQGKSRSTSVIVGYLLAAGMVGDLCRCPHAAGAMVHSTAVSARSWRSCVTPYHTIIL